MATLAVTAADVRALNGAIVRRATAGEAMNVGDAVYISGANGNIPVVSKTAAAVLATGNLFGVVVAGDPAKNGATAIASGDPCDVCAYGPVAGIAGTAGGFVWAGDTAGTLTDAAGTKSTIAGIVESANVVFIRPMQALRSV